MHFNILTLTNEQTDGRTGMIALPPSLMRSVIKQQVIHDYYKLFKCNFLNSCAVVDIISSDSERYAVPLPSATAEPLV